MELFLFAAGVLIAGAFLWTAIGLDRLNNRLRAATEEAETERVRARAFADRVNGRLYELERRSGAYGPVYCVVRPELFNRRNGRPH